jgi:hypothetical protein
MKGMPTSVEAVSDGVFPEYQLSQLCQMREATGVGPVISPGPTYIYTSRTAGSLGDM